MQRRVNEIKYLHFGSLLGRVPLILFQGGFVPFFAPLQGLSTIPTRSPSLWTPYRPSYVGITMIFGSRSFQPSVPETTLQRRQRISVCGPQWLTSAIMSQRLEPIPASHLWHSPASDVPCVGLTHPSTICGQADEKTRLRLSADDLD